MPVSRRNEQQTNLKGGNATSKGRIMPPLKWHGGKYYIANQIVALMPPHLHYVEPYAGGLSVLLARDPGDRKLWLSQTGDHAGLSEVVNDLDNGLVNFWRVLRGDDW